MATTGPDPRPRTFVLVPGAWLGAWSWHPVARRLRDRGHRVVALTLPGLSYDDDPAAIGMADAVDAIVSEVERRDLRDVVLVAHSWGGYPATGAVHRLGSRVAMVVYYNALVPARGVALLDEDPEAGRRVRAAIERSPDTTMTLSWDVVRTLVIPDGPPALQRLVFDLALPQPGGYMLQGVDVPPVTELGIEVRYVVGAEDNALGRPGHEHAARLGLTPIVISGSHMGMLHRPDELVAILVGLL